MRSMPLQLMSIFTLIFLVLPPPFSTAGRYARPGCPDWCGNLKIPYPFGVGSNCSFDSYFNITCNTSANPHKAYLSMLNKEVIEITDRYIRVKYPNLVSVCYDLSGGNGTNVTAKSYNQSMTVDLSGTPYTLSETNLLTAIGCDDMVVKSNGSWVGGGCSAFCADKNDTGGVGYCPNNRTSLGNGCCQSHIPGDGSKGSLGAELIDMSGNFLRRKLFSCSYAFIQEWIYWDNSAFSYPLYYLDNSTAFLKDDWASTSTPPVVRLSWSLGVENCSQAQLNSTTFACQDSKTVCFDYADEHTIEEFKGYFCRCVEGYEGNPYLPKGCQEISLSNSIAKFGCPDQCGDLSILFPFGVGPNCYTDPSFEIICNASIYPPKPYLAILKAEIIQLTNSSIRVKYPNQTGIACYNLSDYQRGITKTEEHRLIIDLLRTQYSLSDGNWITAVGCDDMVVGIVGQGNRSFVGASCASVCLEEETNLLSWDLACPFARDVTRQSTRDGYGCCHAPIPRGTTYLEANLSDLSGQQQRRKFMSCSYVFVNYNDRSDINFPVGFLNYSTAMQTKTLQQSTGELMLDWRIGSENCSEAKLNHANFACRGNSKCIEFDTKVGGYLCICSEGYQGNPYITSGCQDIDECADNTINPCNAKSSCNNTQGSVTCLCPKGYYGDGRKDGIGCINLQQVMSKQMIILIGMGSGLGFLVLLLLLFWLYKVLRKRKEQMIKEKFFKRNGGLLFQQQTNEGVFGKTKIFQANELVVATDNFNESRILGQGGQGTVYKGRRSLDRRLAPVFDNIHRPRGLNVVDWEQEMEGNNVNPNNIHAIPPRNMRDFAHPVIGASTSCLILGEAARNYELKTIHFSQLPTFYGMPTEDALNFIREFYAVVQTFPLQGLNEDQLKMRCFPYTLKDRAKTWFMSLPANSLANWNDVYEKFMAKYYPSLKTQDLRAQIVTFTQSPGEGFHEAWDRFRGLQQQCPHHHLAPELLNQFFYDGLSQNFQYMVDNAAGGDIGGRTADEVSNIYETMATTSQQKSVRGKRASVNEANPSYDVTKQLAELSRQVGLLRTAKKAPQQAMGIETCGICGEYGHGANLCQRPMEPESSEEAQFYALQEQVHALQGFQPSQPYNPYSQPYNPGWGNHPNVSWSQPQQVGGQAPFYPTPQQFSVQPNQPPRPSLHDTLQSFMQATQRRFESIEASVKRIEVQVGQIAGTVGELVKQMKPEKLSSQPEQAQSITVRREGKGIDNEVVETVSFSMNETKDIPSSSFVENCSFINSIDLLAEKVFVQEHVLDERSMERVRFELKEKPPDDKEEEDLSNAELKRVMERVRFELKEKPPDEIKEEDLLVPVLKRGAGIDRSYYFDPP